jgi:hypothetical protein
MEGIGNGEQFFHLSPSLMLLGLLSHEIKKKKIQFISSYFIDRAIPFYVGVITKIIFLSLLPCLTLPLHLCVSVPLSCMKLYELY